MIHPNSKPYNFLAYEINKKFFCQFRDVIKGDLYDLGCGEKPYKSLFNPWIQSYTGVDWANSYHHVRPEILADLNEALPIEAGVADTVVSVSVLEHIREPLEFLAEANRILKPGGYIVLQVPFMWWEHEGPYDYFRFTRFGLNLLLDKAGFVDVEIHPQTGFWVMWLLKLNYQTTTLIRGPRLIRALVKIPLIVLWYVNQRIAPCLDAFWRSDGETAAYFAIARKQT